MEKELREKILELFEYRQLPDLIKYGGQEWDKDYYEKLIKLQYHIYRLDHELETHWKVDMKIVEHRWQAIYQALSDLGIAHEDHDAYCRHIYKYQKHELDIRKMKLPTRLSMEYFYFYKSCDVKLLRKIIYKNNAKLSRTIKESQWRLFDLVTEINDDVADLQEDISTINGNRFLISLKQFGEKTTADVFGAFLDELTDRNASVDLSFEALNLNKWTQVQIADTKKLLLSQIDKFDDLDTSKYDFLMQKEMESL